MSGSRGASASSCRQQTSRTRLLTTVASLLLILSAQICMFNCMNMVSRVRPRICGLYTTKTCHLQTANGLTLLRLSDRRCCRRLAESSGNKETPPLMTYASSSPTTDLDVDALYNQVKISYNNKRSSLLQKHMSPASSARRKHQVKSALATFVSRHLHTEATGEILSNIQY